MIFAVERPAGFRLDLGRNRLVIQLRLGDGAIHDLHIRLDHWTQLAADVGRGLAEVDTVKARKESGRGLEEKLVVRPRKVGARLAPIEPIAILNVDEFEAGLDESQAVALAVQLEEVLAELRGKAKGRS